MTDSGGEPRRDWLSWIALAVSIVGIAVVILAVTTRWGGIVHGHPAYAVLLVVTVAGCLLAGVLALRKRRRDHRIRRLVGRGLLVALGAAWIAVIAWLQPYTAVEPAIEAMQTDAAVTVTETPTEIVLAPAGEASETAVFFQPGALVDARAYAAVLRPLTEAGFTVILPKQPLGIAFLALGAFDDARSRHPEIADWILGGHSLGGTVAAFEADEATEAGVAPVTGLLFFASYPAGDLSGSSVAVLSISGSNDGLATPAKIDASRSDLPATAEFVVIDGASHAQFGAYGLQPGDGTATIGDEDAREQISEQAQAFVRALAG